MPANQNDIGGHYHLGVKNIGKRCDVNNAIAAAAYRAGVLLRDHSTGKEYDYRRKEWIYAAEIVTPDPSIAWVQDRESLWNEVHRANTRANARYAKEIVIALPTSFSKERRVEIIRQFVLAELVEKYGLVTDIAFHNFEGGHSHNPHVHIMFPIRKVEADGLGVRVKALNSIQFICQVRRAWSNQANFFLAVKDRIDDRSYRERGIDREPTRHLGRMLFEMEKRGVRTRIGDENREIVARNRERERAREREAVECDRER